MPGPVTPRRLVAALWLGTIVSALAVVYASHQCRLLISEFARLQQAENRLQMAWGQYLLEQSSLANLSLIEQRALDDLEMRVPQIHEAVMVQP